MRLEEGVLDALRLRVRLHLAQMQVSRMLVEAVEFLRDLGLGGLVTGPEAGYLRVARGLGSRGGLARALLQQSLEHLPLAVRRLFHGGHGVGGGGHLGSLDRVHQTASFSKILTVGASGAAVGAVVAGIFILTRICWASWATLAPFISSRVEISVRNRDWIAT